MNFSKLEDGQCQYESYGQRTLIINGACIPPLVFLGVLSNFMDIWIFSNKYKRKVAVNQFLVATSITDLFILLNSFIMFSFLAWADFLQKPEMVHFGNIVAKWSFPFGLMAQSASVWFTSALTAYKFIGICFPFYSRTVCTIGRVKFAISLIAALSVFCNLPRFFEIQLLECFIDRFNNSIYLLAPTTFRNDPTYHAYYIGYGYTILMFLIPFSILITMNTSIVIGVRRNAMKRKSSRNPDNNSCVSDTRNSFKRESKTTVMLVVIVFSFVLSNSLALISNLIEMIMELTHEKSESWMTAYSIMVDFSSLSIVANCSLNTWIYYSFSQEYRKLVKELFCEMKRRICCTPKKERVGAILRQNRKVIIKKSTACEDV